jgi:hypothetical protein
VVPWPWKCFQESTAFSALILPRERELSLEHAQRCSFLIMEQSCGPLAVGIVPGNHYNFSTYLAMRAGAQSGAYAEVQFIVYGRVLWYPGCRNNSRKHCDFSTYLTKRVTAQSGACAYVQFPDYGTVLWSPGCRNDSRKALRFQHLSCQESESAVWHMRRGVVS